MDLVSIIFILVVWLFAWIKEITTKYAPKINNWDTYNKAAVTMSQKELVKSINSGKF